MKLRRLLRSLPGALLLLCLGVGSATAVTPDNYGGGWSGNLVWAPTSSTGAYTVTGPTASLSVTAWYHLAAYNSAGTFLCQTGTVHPDASGNLTWTSYTSGCTTTGVGMYQVLNDSNVSVRTIRPTDIQPAPGPTTTVTATATVTTTTTATATVTAAPVPGLLPSGAPTPASGGNVTTAVEVGVAGVLAVVGLFEFGVFSLLGLRGRGAHTSAVLDD